ncbi:Triosephosphate isomerase [Roseovarius sp. THAF8]|uniref:triose-phosphate isomerase n=1 Tax=Roseovarius sp. THAF8 TaxID=2587846 RepID=UPI0012696C6C|nr:triose-phosphate isomerase [Roseovarius sp. THAF8]QFT96258.1 Triosephosphate isomerase [Roseovarius sp. THAF8]
MARKLAAGNWKMNGTRSALQELSALAQAHPDPSVDILICPPATLIHPAAALMADASVQIGGQDCHAQVSGAHTGDISAQMLADAGATSVILGHSERREDHGESSDAVNAKIRAAHAAGLVAIVCVGESLAQRESASTLEIIGGQLAASLPDACTAANTVIAYEPIWAIGTGRIPTTDQIDEVHDFIRADMIRRFGAEEGGAIPLLYGGSVKPDNAAEIFATDNVDGALVGGASLKAADFSPIIKALEQST